MTQPSLLDLPPTRPKVRRHVRDTSRAQYRDALERLTGRKGEVLRWLAHYVATRASHPTAAELLRLDIDACGDVVWTDETAHLLHVRRGLSDLQASGLVESAGKRVCRVTGRVCHTWRVVER